MSEAQLIEPRKKPRLRFPLVAGLGIVILFLIAFLSSFTGYRSGIRLRTDAQLTMVSTSLLEQYNLGMQDIESKNWDLARQRFEYILRQDPEFPNAIDQLAVVLLQLNTTATPTIALEPTLTPTPDLRGIEDRFNQAEQFLLNNDWTNAIDTLLQVRKEDPNFRAVQMDGMLYLALRNRGMDKIGKEADLEGGIYDLALAERFGPLDTEAQSYLNWARLYITGASFWEVNWEEAVRYFSEIAPQLPYLRDGSGLTSMERYRQALIGLGISRLQSAPCDAVQNLELALSIAPDEEASKAYEQAIQNCESGRGREREKTPQPTPPGPDEPPPTEAPPPTDVPSPTETPTPENP